jgi:hypothetical protein
VHVDQCGAAGDLGEGVGHRNDGRLLQRQDVGEVLWEILQEGLFGGAGITENRGEFQGPQQIVGHATDGGLLSHGCHRLSCYGWASD